MKMDEIHKGHEKRNHRRVIKDEAQGKIVSSKIT